MKEPLGDIRYIEIRVGKILLQLPCHQKADLSTEH